MTEETKIQIVSQPEVYRQQDLTELFHECSKQKDINLILFSNDDEYNLYFDNNEKAKSFVSGFFEYLDNQEEFKFNYKDFSITAFNQDTINHINFLFYQQAQQDIDVLDMVCSELAEEQMKTNERLSAVENYLTSSGIIHYQQFMKELLTILESEEILDKDSIINRMFEQLH